MVHCEQKRLFGLIVSLYSAVLPNNRLSRQKKIAISGSSDRRTYTGTDVGAVAAPAIRSLSSGFVCAFCKLHSCFRQWPDLAGNSRPIELVLRQQQLTKSSDH